MATGFHAHPHVLIFKWENAANYVWRDMSSNLSRDLLLEDLQTFAAALGETPTRT